MQIAKCVHIATGKAAELIALINKRLLVSAAFRLAAALPLSP
jgi:hypothetical protein